MELELQNITDIDSKAVIHKEPIFKTKNTLYYQGLLTNYNYRTYQGYPTTFGNDIEIHDNSISYNDGISCCNLLTIDDNTFKADKLVSYNLDAQGSILDTTSTYSGCLITVVNDPEGNYRVQVNGRTVTKCEHPFAIIKSDRNTDVEQLCVVEAHNNETKLVANIIQLDLVECTATTINSYELEYNSKLNFCSNNAYQINDKLLIGSDWEDQTKSGTYIIGETCCYLPFMGRISIPHDNCLFIFGEPFPNIEDYEICRNKEIRFNIGYVPTICPTTNCMFTVSQWGIQYNCEERINLAFHCVEYEDPTSLVYAYNLNTNNNEITKCIIEPTHSITHCETVCFLCCGYTCPNCTLPMVFDESTCRSFTNPNVNQAPGESWEDNCYLSCIITNINCNRNKAYVYNKYGTQITYNDRIITELKLCRCNKIFCFNGAFESKYYCLTMDVCNNVHTSPIENMTNDGWNAYQCACCTLCTCALNETYPVIAGYCTSNLPTTEYTYCDDLKFIKPTTTVDSGKAWPKIQHTYDWSLGDLNTSWKYGDIKVLTYHGIEIGYSLNGVLLNNINFQGDAIDIVANDSCINIAVGNTVYRYSKCTPLTISKLSDFNYSTNAVTVNNLIREDKVTGSLSLLPSTLGLVPEFRINIDLLPTFNQPNLGNTANDTLFVNYAYNVNMESKFATTSMLLPSFQLGIFVPSDAGSAMNQTIFGTLNTIVEPVIDVSYPICVYVTHTLCSTSVDYLYTCKNNTVSIDVNLQNTTWWTDSSTNYFPVALNTPTTGVNSLNSSVCLNQDYSASYETCDNTMMTVYNNSKQIYRSSSLFTIYGSQYYYDGQAIYYLGTDGTNQLAAYALGLRYLAAASNEAFFFSESDRNIYSFSGSNTINKSIEASAVGDVIDAMYDSSSQLLWVLFTEGLYVQSTVADESSFFDDIRGTKLLSHVRGITILRENEPNITLSISSFDKQLPLELETEWIGMNDTGYKVPYFDVLIYNDELEHDLEISCSLLANGKINEEKRNVHLDKDSFKGSTFYRYRITPRDNNGNAAKIRIYSKDKLSIQGIVIYASEEYVGAGNV